MPNPTLRTVLAARGCAVLVIMLGVAVLIGWLMHLESLMAVVPAFVRMKANSAVCFMACGFAMLCLPPESGPGRRAGSPGRRRTGIALASLSLTVGLLTLAEYAFDADLGLDQLLFRDPQAWVYPGRMAFISALCFCLGGASLLLEFGPPRMRRLAHAAAGSILLIAFAAIIGYLYGVPVLYGSIGNTSMALHTGVGFLILGAGLILSQPMSGFARVFRSAGRGGWIGRRLLAGAIFVPVVLGGLYLLPAVDFGQVRFAMALFAVTLTAVSIAALWFLVAFFERREQQNADFLRLQRETSAKIAESERELRQVTDHLPILLSYADLSGRFVRANRTYERWVGLEDDRLVGRSIREVLGEAYISRTAGAWDQAKSGESVSLETTYPTLQGDRQVQLTYVPDLDVEGQVRGIVCMVVDVEEQRRAEFALRQSEKLAVVGRMASSIAHEINNPLEAVTNLLYLVGSNMAGNPELAESTAYIDLAQEQLGRVSQIVTETLRFHRQTGRSTRCRLAEVIEQVLVLQAGRLGVAGIEVERRFRGDTLLTCREGEIRQVLANLIGNAADAMNTGGRLLVRIQPSHRPSTGERGVALTVADTGSGISAATRGKLFEPFQSTKGDKGSGLGLWISREIIDRHHGTIGLRSSQRENAHGTVFRLFLPFPAN